MANCLGVSPVRPIRASALIIGVASLLLCCGSIPRAHGNRESRRGAGAGVAGKPRALKGETRRGFFVEDYRSADGEEAGSVSRGLKHRRSKGRGETLKGPGTKSPKGGKSRKGGDKKGKGKKKKSPKKASCSSVGTKKSKGSKKNCEDANVNLVDEAEVAFLASDELGGRDNGGTGSLITQDYLIDQLLPFATGLNSGEPDERVAFKQALNRGTNILGLIEGKSLEEFVIVGAHYDHLSSCRQVPSASQVCNGAADNAASVAIVLAIGRHIAALPPLNKPLRSLILAFWDREEDGLLGSEYYLNSPLAPMDKMTAYLNWDIQGSNLLPSLRNISFAIGSETGGPALQDALRRSFSNEGLDMQLTSAILGQYRSDYTNFIDQQIPTVFFSDSTNGCYHTTGDEVETLDFAKLEKQARIGLRLTLDLLNTAATPSFVAAPLVSFDDMEMLSYVLGMIADDDFNLFVRDISVGQTNQERLMEFKAVLDDIVEGGEGSFNPTVALFTLFGFFMDFDEIQTSTECDGFLSDN